MTYLGFVIAAHRSMAGNARSAALAASSCAAVMDDPESSGRAFVLDVVSEKSPIFRLSYRNSIPLFLSEPQAYLKS